MKDKMKKKIYMINIQDGENNYYEWTLIKPNTDYVDGFMRAVKNITEFKLTDEEMKILRKFQVI